MTAGKVSGTEPIKAYKDGVYGNGNQYEVRGEEGEESYIKLSLNHVSNTIDLSSGGKLMEWRKDSGI